MQFQIDPMLLHFLPEDRSYIINNWEQVIYNYNQIVIKIRAFQAYSEIKTEVRPETNIITESNDTENVTEQSEVINTETPVTESTYRKRK
jgi:hypothetical protein